MKNGIRILIITIVWILHGGCATLPLVQPKIEKEFTTVPIPYEKAFRYVIEAGDDIGFEPAKYPKPDKEKGIVILLAKREMGERVAKALFFSPLWTQFQLEIRVNREGETAEGVHLKVTQVGGATIKREETENLARAYLDALRKRWR